MMYAATAPDATRHRLLEGVLLRLARRPDAGAFVLRGGVLLRHWFRPVPRSAEDLDLVATVPLTVAEATARFLAVLADGAVADGVAYDVEGVRAEGIKLDTGSPGVRIFVTGEADGAEADFHADLTFGPPPRPAPVFGELPTASGAAVRLWTCRPETVLGHKMQALHHLGLLGWRPKDLHDLYLLLTRVPLDTEAARTAMAAYLGDLGAGASEARALFGPAAWWGMKMAAARWQDFVHTAKGQGAPRDLAEVVAAAAERLAPILEGWR